jgi:hypothetical protein
MGTAAATSTKQVYQRSGIKQRWFIKMMRQMQINAAGNRRFFRPNSVQTQTSVQEFFPSHPNIRVHDLADWRSLVYGLPAMTAKVREDVRHKGIRKDLFPSLHAESGYTVFDPVRPIPESMSEQKVSALFPSTNDWGEDMYLMYGRKREVECDDTDDRREIEQAESCMSKKHHYSLVEIAKFNGNIPYRKFTDSIPYRILVYYPTLLERIRMPTPNKAGGTWGETNGCNRTWKPNKKAKPAWIEVLWTRLKKWTGKAAWTATRLLPSDAELLMLPLSKRIGWRRKRPSEGGGGKYVKYVKHW